MTVPSLPDFERTIRLSQGNLDAAELAESHGLLCGLLCREASGTASDFLGHLGAMQLLVNPASALEAVMEEAFESTRRQLEDEEFGFTLWLPDDDDVLQIESIIGSRFECRIHEEVEFGSRQAVIPQVTGEAHITGTHRFLIDPRDPFRDGFLLH